MPTPAERKALVFLAGLMVLGTGARMTQATAHVSAPSPAAQAALRRQIAAVDSVRNKAAKKKRKGSGRVVVRSSNGSYGATATSRPSSRQEVVVRRVPVAGATTHVTVLDATVPDVPSSSGTGTVDLDRASAAEIEPLPGIGPVLAKRIVADRDALGPFGSLEGFQRVKGIGKVLAKRLSPHVTFSLEPRPPLVLDQGSAAAPMRGRRRPP